MNDRTRHLLTEIAKDCNNGMMPFNGEFLEYNEVTYDEAMGLMILLATLLMGIVDVEDTMVRKLMARGIARLAFDEVANTGTGPEFKAL